MSRRPLAPGGAGRRAGRRSRADGVRARFGACDDRACDDGCVDVRVAASPEGLVELALPAGDYRLSVEYRTPGRTTGWLLFIAGTVLCALATAATAFVRRTRSSASGRADS